jgi:hypothetical protein
MVTLADRVGQRLLEEEDGNGGIVEQRWDKEGAARNIAPHTPPPAKSRSLTAFTIASPVNLVISSRCNNNLVC